MGLCVKYIITLQVVRLVVGGFVGVVVKSGGLNSSEEAAWVQGSVGVEFVFDGLHEG